MKVLISCTVGGAGYKSLPVVGGDGGIGQDD